MGRHPNKRELFENFIKEHGKPAYYIGMGDKDITSCNELGIPAISVSWISKGKVKGDYDIANIRQLKKIIE